MFPVTKYQQCVNNVVTSNVDNVNTTRALSAFDSVSTMRVCRVCLAMSVKMYHMSEHKLSVMYERVTGVEITPEDKLPKMLCWECAARLSSANKFVEKAFKTQWILLNKINSSSLVTVNDIESIDRLFYQLKSTLGFHVYGENDSNLYNIKESNKIYNYNDDKSEAESCGVNDEASNEKEKMVTETSESDEQVLVKSEYLEEEEVDQNVADEDYDKVHISDEEINFQNTNAVIQTPRIIKHENISDEELATDNASNISKVTAEVNHVLVKAIESCEVVKHRGNIKYSATLNSRRSEALPHRKELRVVLEDVMLILNKHNTQDNVEHLTAHLSKDNGSVHHMQKKKKKIVKKGKCLNSKFDKIHVASSVDSTDSSIGLVVCDICDKQFNDKNMLIRHIREHPTMYSCTHCRYKTSYQTILKMHINCVHMKSTVFTCNHCSFVTHNKINLSKHINNVHSNISNDSYCGFTAFDKQSKKKIYYCSLCNYKNSFRFLLTRHIKTKHGITNVYYCSFCSYIAYNKVTLTEHVKGKHTGKDVNNCSLCSFKANNNITLGNHMLSKHIKTVFNCSYCAFETHCQTRLTRHVKTLHS